MKSTPTERSNVKLTLPGGTENNTLPAERIEIEDPNFGTKTPGFESHWQPDDGERRALLNGANIILRVWGAQHPPVAVHVAEPTEASVPAYSRDQLKTAAPNFLMAFSEYMSEVERKQAAGEPIPTPEERGAHALDLFWKAIEEARPEAVQKASAAWRRQHNGGSHSTENGDAVDAE